MALIPQIVGVVGLAGAGKDTVTNFALEALGVGAESVAFANPIKKFAGQVFGFTELQLWGPSEHRNAVDERFTVKPDVEHALAERAHAWVMFQHHARAWLADVLPPGLDLEHCYVLLAGWMRDVMKQQMITPRYVLQTLGTEFGRKVSESIWCDKGIRAAQQIVARGKWAFIRDVRFLDEGRGLRAIGAELWHVTRPGHQSGTGAAGVVGHASEKDQESPEMLALTTKGFVNDSTLDALRQQVSMHVLGL